MPRKKKEDISVSETKEEIKEDNKKASFKPYDNSKLNELAYEDVKERSIIINFDKVLNRKDLGDFSQIKYKLKRRAFYSFSDYISYNMNYLLNKMPILAIPLLDIHTKIFSDEEYSINNLYEDIRENIFSIDELIDLINNIVDENYSITLDKDSSTMKSIIEDLQVTDSVNKSIIKSSILIRFLIVIMIEYEEKYELHIKDYNNIFKEAIKIFSDNNNCLSKIYKIVDSRIESTEYSEKVIWNYLKKLGIDPYTVKSEIKSSIIFSIIGKIQNNTSVISFLDVVIKNKIIHKFTYSYPVNFKTFKIEQDNDDVDENDKIDILLTKEYAENEATIIIHKLTMKKFIEKQHITKDELEYVKFRVNNILNDFQKKLIEIYFHNRFKIFIDDEVDYWYYLLIIMSRELFDKGFNIIPKILLSRILKDNVIIYSSKKLTKQVITSEIYKEFLENYNFIFDLIQKDDFILKYSSISNYKFEYYNDDTEEFENLIIDKNSLILELISFTKLLN